MKAQSVRLLNQIAERAGAVSYQVLRSKKHLIVEFEDAKGRTARVSVSQTPSDFRVLNKAVNDVKKAYQ